MSTFPQLKTGAVAQYPLQRTIRFSTGIAQFVDGTEQRYRQLRGGLKRWTIDLDLLDEDEMAAFLDFALDEEGAFGEFAFTDPIDGVVYPACRFENDALVRQFVDTGHGSTSVVVVQIQKG